MIARDAPVAKLIVVHAGSSVTIEAHPMVASQSGWQVFDQPRGERAHGELVELTQWLAREFPEAKRVGGLAGELGERLAGVHGVVAVVTEPRVVEKKGEVGLRTGQVESLTDTVRRWRRGEDVRSGTFNTVITHVIETSAPGLIDWRTQLAGYGFRMAKVEIGPIGGEAVATGTAVWVVGNGPAEWHILPDRLEPGQRFVHPELLSSWSWQRQPRSSGLNRVPVIDGWWSAVSWLLAQYRSLALARSGNDQDARGGGAVTPAAPVVMMISELDASGLAAVPVSPEPEPPPGVHAALVRHLMRFGFTNAVAEALLRDPATGEVAWSQPIDWFERLSGLGWPVAKVKPAGFGGEVVAARLPIGWWNGWEWFVLPDAWVGQLMPEPKKLERWLTHNEQSRDEFGGRWGQNRGKPTWSGWLRSNIARVLAENPTGEIPWLEKFRSRPMATITVNSAEEHTSVPVAAVWPDGVRDDDPHDPNTDAWFALPSRAVSQPPGDVAGLAVRLDVWLDRWYESPLGAAYPVPFDALTRWVERQWPEIASFADANAEAAAWLERLAQAGWPAVKIMIGVPGETAPETTAAAVWGYRRWEGQWHGQWLVLPNSAGTDSAGTDTAPRPVTLDGWIEANGLADLSQFVGRPEELRKQLAERMRFVFWGAPEPVLAITTPDVADLTYPVEQPRHEEQPQALVSRHMAGINVAELPAEARRALEAITRESGRSERATSYQPQPPVAPAGGWTAWWGGSAGLLASAAELGPWVDDRSEDVLPTELLPDALVGGFLAEKLSKAVTVGGGLAVSGFVAPVGAQLDGGVVVVGRRERGRQVPAVVRQEAVRSGVPFVVLGGSGSSGVVEDVAERLGWVGRPVAVAVVYAGAREGVGLTGSWVRVQYAPEQVGEGWQVWAGSRMVRRFAGSLRADALQLASQLASQIGTRADPLPKALAAVLQAGSWARTGEVFRRSGSRLLGDEVLAAMDRVVAARPAEARRSAIRTAVELERGLSAVPAKQRLVLRPAAVQLWDAEPVRAGRVGAEFAFDYLAADPAARAAWDGLLLSALLGGQLLADQMVSLAAAVSGPNAAGNLRVFRAVAAIWARGAEAWAEAVELVAADSCRLTPDEKFGWVLRLDGARGWLVPNGWSDTAQLLDQLTDVLADCP